MEVEHFHVARTLKERQCFKHFDIAQNFLNPIHRVIMGALLF